MTTNTSSPGESDESDEMVGAPHDDLGAPVVSRREFASGVAVQVHQTMYRLPRFWVGVHHRRGVIGDNRLVPSRHTGRSSRAPAIVIAVRGHGAVAWRGLEVEMSEGHALRLPALDGYVGRNHSRGDVDVVVVQWSSDDDEFVSPETGRLGHGASEAASRLVDASPPSHPLRPEAWAGMLDELVAGLVAEGMMAPRLPGMAWEEPARMRLQRIVRAIDEGLGHRLPAVSDVESVLRLSPAQTRRQIAAARRDGALDARWSQAKCQWRLQLAAMLLTVDGATVDGVAKAVGYHGRNTLARAFRRSGLMPPTELARLAIAGW